MRSLEMKIEMKVHKTRTLWHTFILATFVRVYTQVELGPVVNVIKLFLGKI